MLYTGRDQDPRRDAARSAADDRRTFTRRIDCADAGRRQAVNPSPGTGIQRDPQLAGRRRLDID
jgi:hypothetical protein